MYSLGFFCTRINSHDTFIPSMCQLGISYTFCTVIMLNKIHKYVYTNVSAGHFVDRHLIKIKLVYIWIFLLTYFIFVQAWFFLIKERDTKYVYTKVSAGHFVYRQFLNIDLINTRKFNWDPGDTLILPMCPLGISLSYCTNVK